MHQRRKFLKCLAWFSICAAWLALGHTASAQVPNETYDFSIAKGILEFGRGHYEQAATLFEQARQAMPGDPEASEYLGQTFLRLKKHREAEALFYDVSASHPDRPQSWLGLAIAQSQLGKYHDALQSLDQAQKLDPKNPLIYFYQGVISHELKSFDQSSALFSRAMALSPDLTPTVRYYTGMSYYERGLMDQAQKELEAAIASGEPESELARVAQAILQQRTAAPKGPKQWDLNLSVSGQYDSNVVLLPIGIQPPGGSTGISQKDDFRTTFYVRGEYRPIQTPVWTAGIAYGFYQSLQQKLTSFNIQDNAPSIFLQRQIGVVTARLQYAFDYVRVGQEPFLVSNSVQPTFLIAEGDSYFTQIQLRYQNKDFQDDRFVGNSFRDGKNWLAGITQYAYFASGGGHLRFGYTFDTDRTGGGSPGMATPGVQSSADWDYKAHRFAIGLAVPEFWTLQPNLAFDYYHLNYDNPNSFSPDGTTRRRDNVLFLTATIGRSITKWLSIAAEYNYTRDQSNVSVFDYNRSVFSLTLNSRF
ncbi:MAG TPA: tetratricopeptide repeat protein [Nitrospiraceae bacterium]|jgi:Flp pilus assembly protein TadD